MKLREEVLKKISILFALISVVLIIIILAFIFNESLPVLKKYNFIDIILNSNYAPTAKPPMFGLLSMILTTLITTIIAMLISIIIAILVAICLLRFINKCISDSILFLNDILVGIPSIIYGFFALKMIVPIIYQSNLKEVPGNSLLAAIIVLIIMALPTITSIVVSTFENLDYQYTLTSRALGANNLQTIFKIELPMARSGILVALILGSSRVIGETMAVLLVSGNVPNMPISLLTPVRTLTSNIATEINYASGLHQNVLFLSGVILFIIICILNVIMVIVTRKGRFEND